MSILEIECTVSDFDAWKRAFASGWTVCAAKHRGLRRYRVFRAFDDPERVRVDLDFDSPLLAESVRAALSDLWDAGLTVPALAHSARARVIEAVDAQECRVADHDAAVARSYPAGSARLTERAGPRR
jgi:hypothetical protein